MSPRVENLPRRGKRATLGRLCGLGAGAADRGERVLWLSGDGHQAALFHLGALTRLNELGLLDQVDTVGAVSGGAIAAAVLATRVGWPFQGRCPEWAARVAEPLRELAGGGQEGAAAGRRPFPGTAGEAALEERYARELLGAMGGEPRRGPRFVFGASGLALSGITGSWEECLEWEVDGSVAGGYEPELVAAVVAALPSGLGGLGEAERAVLENHGYLLTEAAAQGQGVAAKGDLEAAAVRAPHPRWLDGERVRAALAARGRPTRIRRLHLPRRGSSKSWERAG
jgi:hypothetical protein